MDRLRLDDSRLAAMADQLLTLAGVPAEPASRVIRELPVTWLRRSGAGRSG